MATLLRTMGENFCVVMFALAIFVAIVNTIARRGTPHGRFAEQLFRWTSMFAVGVTGLYTFACHVFSPAETARLIGWATSPFQYEVGMADLTVGVLGVMAFYRNVGFRVAASVAAVCWLGGDAIGHIRQMVIAHNFAPGNAGSWFWCDLLVPLVMVVALYFSAREKHDTPGAIRTGRLNPAA